MAVKKSQKSLLEKTLITIVRLGLSVKATRSTRGNSTQRRLKKQERKAEKKAVVRKRRSSLAKAFKFDLTPVKLKISKGVKEPSDEDLAVLDSTLRSLKAEEREDKKRKAKLENEKSNTKDNS